VQPAYFIAHGSPMLALEDDPYTRFVCDLGRTLRPRAAVVFSAHWESPVQRVSDVEHYGTMHDFGGFPRALYQVTYPAKGDQALARRIRQALPEAQPDGGRGLDHGAWMVLRMLFPEANVPVVAMSVNPDASPQEQYEVGAALADLRRDDVLIIASGGTVHNFSTMRLQGGETDPWAVAFDDWVLEQAKGWDLNALFDYEYRAPHARLAVPANGKEHFIPLFYAMGAADDQRTARELHRSYSYGNLSHAVWQFGG